jgi:hypothetical protein
MDGELVAMMIKKGEGKCVLTMSQAEIQGMAQLTWRCCRQRKRCGCGGGMLSEWSMGDSFAIRSTEFLPGAFHQGLTGLFPAIGISRWIIKCFFLHDRIRSLDTCQYDSI